MKVLLLGATGRTGRHLLQQALELGHSVHVLVRNKDKIKIVNDRLSLFEGNPSDKAALQQAMKGCDAILSALNISRTSDFPWARLRTPKDILSSVMKNVIDLSSQENIHRFVFTSAWGVGETKKDIPAWFRWFIDNSNIRYPYLDHERQEALAAASNLQWTAVRPVFLTNSTKKKKVLVSFQNIPRPTLMISRSSVAAFMLDVLENGLFPCQAPVISAK